MTRIAIAVLMFWSLLSTAFARQQAGPDADLTRRAALISVSRPDNADDSSWQREIASHATMIVHDATLAAAMADEKSPLRSSKWFAAQADAMAAHQWLRTHLHADPVPNTRLIRVYFDDRPGDEVALLETIVDTYIAEQHKLAQGTVLDRTAALNSLKTKYEIRTRELADRANNLMLRMQVGQVGSPNMYSTVDLELRDAIGRQADLRATLAGATAKRDAIKADPETAKDNARQAALVQAGSEVATANASLDAINKRVDQLKSVLGDLAIAMSDYNSTQTELAATREARRDVSARLDRLQTTANNVAVQWAQHPVADAK